MVITIAPTATSWTKKRTNMYQGKEIKMSKTTYCGECEHFEPDYDPYGLFDGYCDLYERGRNKNSECYAK